MCSGKNVRLTPMKNSQNCQLAEALAQHSPGDLRKPVVDRRRTAGRRRRRSARSAGARRRNSVSWTCRSSGTEPSMMPVSPPISRMKKKPSTNSNGVSHDEAPGPHRRDPAEDLQRRGNRDHEAHRGEEALAELRHVGREHVMHPQPERQEAGGDQRQHDRVVAEHRPPRERRDDRRDEAERRDEDEVDLGMSEEPEQVLPEQRSPPSAGLKKCVPSMRSNCTRLAASITIGIAKMIITDVTSDAQTNSGMRRSDMPGARILRMVVVMSTATISPIASVRLTSMFQTSARLPMPYCGPGERHVREPAGVGAGIDGEAAEQRQRRRAGRASRRRRSCAGTRCCACRSSAARGRARSPASPARRTGTSSSCRAS